MPLASELRARARGQLGSIFSSLWLLLLVASLIYSAVIGVVSYTVVGAIVLGGPMMIGLAAVFLKTARGSTEVDFADLFYGFRNGMFTRNLLLGLLQSIYLFLWSLLFVIPGIVKFYSYAMSSYLALDHPEWSADDCITASRKMMDGHRFRLFCLDLSFIGWYIVGALACGIGTLWVAPYHFLARAHFYQDLLSRTQEVH